VKYRLRAAALPLVLLIAASCATVTSGSAVVVDAERSVNIAFETVDTFLYIEHNHQAEIASFSADAHQIAEALRTQGPEAFRKARRLIDVYKTSRNDEAKADMMTAVAFVSALANEVQPYLAKYEAHRNGGN
jgi:hypothetical protein